MCNSRAQKRTVSTSCNSIIIDLVKTALLFQQGSQTHDTFHMVLTIDYSVTAWLVPSRQRALRMLTLCDSGLIKAKSAIKVE